MGWMSTTGSDSVIFRLRKKLHRRRRKRSTDHYIGVQVCVQTIKAQAQGQAISFTFVCWYLCVKLSSQFGAVFNRCRWEREFIFFWGNLISLFPNLLLPASPQLTRRRITDRRFGFEPTVGWLLTELAASYGRRRGVDTVWRRGACKSWGVICSDSETSIQDSNARLQCNLKSPVKLQLWEWSSPAEEICGGDFLRCPRLAQAARRGGVKLVLHIPSMKKAFLGGVLNLSTKSIWMNLV